MANAILNTSAVTTAAAPGTRGRVLVVDDELAWCQLAARILGDEHDVSWTTSPYEALEWLRDGQWFDVIVSDQMLLEVGGDELVDARKHMVFLTTSAADTTEDELRLPDVVLRKPVAPGTLRAVIGVMVGGSERA